MMAFDIFSGEPFTAYLAPKGFTRELVQELGGKQADLIVRDQLVLKPGEPIEAAWAQNTWLNPHPLRIASIKDGAKQLKAIQRNWALFSVDNHRRAKLIQQQLPHVSAKPIPFGKALPDSPLGSWTLWSHDTILAAPDCSNPVPNGEYHFEENKVDPPNRAYLKLWETFTRLGRYPEPGELCLDLGSSPGGWSWVAAECGARVFSVDKAPLDDRIDTHPRIQHCQGSGFGLDPRHCGRIDWLFSDMACYPDRLHTLVSRWLEFGQCRNFICTVKLQGDAGADELEPFKTISGSRLMHLSHNKHELTWVLLDAV